MMNPYYLSKTNTLEDSACRKIYLNLSFMAYGYPPKLDLFDFMPFCVPVDIHFGLFP